MVFLPFVYLLPEYIQRSQVPNLLKFHDAEYDISKILTPDFQGTMRNFSKFQQEIQTEYSKLINLRDYINNALSIIRIWDINILKIHQADNLQFIRVSGLDSIKTEIDNIKDLEPALVAEIKSFNDPLPDDPRAPKSKKHK